MNIKSKILSVALAAIMLIPQIGMNAFAADKPKGYVGYDFRSEATGTKPSIKYYEEGGVKWEIADYPSKKQKSLMVSTETMGTNWYVDVAAKSKTQFVLETSVAYTGSIGSFKRIFTCDASNGVYIVFFTIDKSGQLTAYDGTVLAKMREGVFTDISLLIDFEKRCCSVKINGRTKMMDVPLGNDKFTDMYNTRIQMSEIDGDGENFYIKYFRGYEGGKTVNIEQSDETNSSGNNGGATKIKITDDMVVERMKGNVLMTDKTGKALVNNEIKYVDEENKSLAPRIINGRTLVPLRFVSESVGAVVGYDEAAHTASISLNGKNILVNESDPGYTVNGEQKRFDVAPYVEGDRMLVPLRAICEALGKQVFWDKCGYIIVGDNAESFSLDNEKDKRILDKAVRNLIFESPTASDITAAIKANNPNNAHPRLMVRADDVAKIKEKIATDELVASWANELIKKADSMIGLEPINYELINVRMEVSRTLTMRVEPLAFAYLITGDKKYADEAISNLMRVTDTNVFPDWNPYHFLDVGDMATGVAIGYDWCYDAMTPSQRTQIKTALINYAFNEGMRDFTFDSTRKRTWAWNDPNSTAYPQNWIAVCCGGLDMAALAIGDEPDAADLAGQIIAMGLEPMKDLLAEFAPDGAWFEGPGYWEYSYEFFAYAFASMQSALGTDFGLTNSPGFKEGPYYIIGNAGTAGSFNMNDCAEALVDSPEFFWLSDIFGDPALTKYRLNYLGGKTTSDYKNIIWYNPDYANDETPIAEDGMWREFNVASSRTGYGDADLYAAIHGGEDGRDIGDLDYGEFIIDIFGKRWAKDLGSEHANYVVGHEGTRWSYYRCRGEGHNVIILNPDGTEDQDKSAICPINKFEHNDVSMFAVTDLTAAHAYRGAESVVRGMYVDKANKSVTIQDEVKMKEPSEMYWFMHTPAQIEISADGRTAVLTQGIYKMGATLTGSENLKFTQMAAEAMEDSPHPSDSESDESGITKLVIHANDITDEKFAVKFYPLAGDEVPEADTGDCTPIENWSLIDADGLPRLTSLNVSGEEIPVNGYDTFYSPQARLDEFLGASFDGMDIKADGNGDITVIPMTEDNRVAKVRIQKDGMSKTYIVSINTMSSDDVEFEQIKPDYVGKSPSGMTQLKFKDVQAPIAQAEHIPANTIDGDFNTRWTSDVIGGTIQFDLGEVKDASAMGVAFYFGNERSTFYRAAVSEDGKTWTLVGNIKSGGDTLDLEVYKFPRQKVRYLKLAGFGNTEGSAWFNVSEVRLYDQ